MPRGKIFSVQNQGSGASAQLTGADALPQLRVASSGRVTCFAPRDMGRHGRLATAVAQCPPGMPNPHAVPARQNNGRSRTCSCGAVLLYESVILITALSDPICWPYPAPSLQNRNRYEEELGTGTPAFAVNSWDSGNWDTGTYKAYVFALAAFRAGLLLRRLGLRFRRAHPHQ